MTRSHVAAIFLSLALMVALPHAAAADPPTGDEPTATPTSRGCLVNHSEKLTVEPGNFAEVTVSVDASCRLTIQRTRSTRAAISGGKNASVLASSWRSCIAKNLLYDVRYPPGTAIHTRVESSINFNYDGSSVTDVLNSNALAQAQWTYSLASQTHYGTPAPDQTPWYGYYQWSTNSDSRAQFNDWAGWHHEQVAVAYGYGNGACSGSFSYYGLVGLGEEYQFYVYSQ